MSLDFLRSLVKSTGKDIIHKAAVEKIMDITFKNLKEEVLPSFSELLKVKPEHFNETVKLVMEKSLKKKDSKEQVKEYINIINFVKNSLYKTLFFFLFHLFSYYFLSLKILRIVAQFHKKKIKTFKEIIPAMINAEAFKTI